MRYFQNWTKNPQENTYSKFSLFPSIPRILFVQFYLVRIISILFYVTIGVEIVIWCNWAMNVTLRFFFTFLESFDIAYRLALFVCLFVRRQILLWCMLGIIIYEECAV